MAGSPAVVPPYGNYRDPHAVIGCTLAHRMMDNAQAPLCTGLVRCDPDGACAACSVVDCFCAMAGKRTGIKRTGTPTTSLPRQWAEQFHDAGNETCSMGRGKRVLAVVPPQDAVVEPPLCRDIPHLLQISAMRSG